MNVIFASHFIWQARSFRDVFVLFSNLPFIYSVVSQETDYLKQSPTAPGGGGGGGGVSQRS